jgi:hypothetical protein
MFFFSMVLYILFDYFCRDLIPYCSYKKTFSQNSPPQSSFLISGYPRNISDAEMLFNIPTTFAIEYLGGKLKNTLT